MKKKWCIPTVGAEFVWRMEDVLDLYALPYDPRRPLVCFDEHMLQLIAEKRLPLPAKPGRPERFDYEYRRQGTRNLFLFFQPLAGWRHVRVTERRTKMDFAHCMQYLADEPFPEAECVVVVLDNLNTHTPAALYEAFEPEEAKRILNSTLNAHKKEWEIEAWRLEHEDHETIPQLYRDLNSFPFYQLDGGELHALNVDRGELRRRLVSVTKSFKTASKFYARKAFLSPRKTTDWQRAKVAVRELVWYREVIFAARKKFPAYSDRPARHDWLADKASERKAARRKQLRRQAANQEES